MNRRLIFVGIAGAAVIGGVVPAIAAPAEPAHVTVTQQDGGVFVGVSTGNGAPVAGAGFTQNGICAGLGEDIPVCVPLSAISVSPPPVHARSDNSRQSLPFVYHDSTRTTVGIGVAGVTVYSDGRICPRVATQDWPCTPAILGL